MKKLKHKGSCKTAHPDQSHANWEEIQGNKDEITKSGKMLKKMEFEQGLSILN